MPPLAWLPPIDYFPAMILVPICAKLGTLLPKTILTKCFSSQEVFLLFNRSARVCFKPFTKFESGVVSGAER
jgi:hypothetical protein